MSSAEDRETRAQEIGRALFAALAEEGPLHSASTLLSGRAVQRRLLAQAVADPRFRARLFRFIDVYPSLRDSGDLVRHLRAYLDDRGEPPPPLDRLLASGAARRLPSWAVARLTDRAMQRTAKGLIAGRDATEAMSTLRRLRRQQTAFSIDLLGEATLSEDEADEYLRRYTELLDALPPRLATWSSDPQLDSSPAGDVPRVNVSLKITSVYSQVDPLDFEGSRHAIVQRLRPLFVKAAQVGAFLDIDLEHHRYHDLTYAVFSDLALDPALRDYPHLGVVLQSYLRESVDDLRFLVDLARERGTPITVRLVKGAYWDHEIILAAQQHWPAPVFLEKVQTDAQFEKLAGMLVDEWQWTRPAFATHNIRSIAAALAAAEAAGLAPGAVELQFLHGLADPIRRAAVTQGYRVREYVPVGEMIPGMAYLVRRLLESTAQQSFLQRLFSHEQDMEQLLAPPRVPPTPPAGAQAAEPFIEPVVEVGPAAARPPEPPRFENQPHADFSRPDVRAEMQQALATIRSSLGRDYHLVIDGVSVPTQVTSLSHNPARPDEIVGRVARATVEHADQALSAAQAAYPSWRDTPPRQRAGVLLKAAALMREQRFELAALEVVEAGKPWMEADADVTEAIDFLEYYAREMLRLYRAKDLSDIPGEVDLYLYEPRGVAVVIAPWNFPLAIPTGMVSAALVAGNTVVFKPANPTPVIGYALVRILHEAGIPGGALNFLPGPGSQIGDYLVGDPRVDLIAFTGSLQVGQSIMQKAATVQPGQRNVKRVIAELGGKNAIIVDTDADLDAAVDGVLVSAFGYGGQKCSACSRVIVMDEVYDQFVSRLTKAAASIKIGDPADPGTRLGPVITEEARARILEYIEKGKAEATLVYPPADVGSVPAPAVAGDHTPSERRSPSPTTEPAAAHEAGADHEAAAHETAAAHEAAARTEAEVAVEVTVGLETPTEEAQEGAAGPEKNAGAGDAVDSAAETSSDAAVPSALEPDSSADIQSTPEVSHTPTSEPGHFLYPHVFVDVPPDGVIAQEEIFGPVLAVSKVRKFSDALETALAVRYGLTGGLYSRNPAHIRRAYNEFRVGNLYINRPITGAMVGRQPFGGSRMSGVGSKAGGPDYLLQFMEPRTVTENTVRRGFAPPEEE